MEKKKLSEKQKRAIEARFDRYCRNVIKKAAREICARNDQKKVGNLIISGNNELERRFEG